ncbi:MAG: FkbM family methyltransferase [Candidatus Methylomirabilales bacterium]
MTAWEARLSAFWVRRLLRRPILFRDRYGLCYRLSPTDDLELYFRHRGWFEVAEQEFCRSYLQPGMTAFDVGAYLGVYTALMAKLVGPEGRVHAFEPLSEAYRRLLDTIRLNGLTNVAANRQAVFSRSKGFPLFCYGAPWESLSSLVHRELVREGKRLFPVAEEPVQAISLDEYCEQHAVGRIDFLKLDVEGVEGEVLEGAQALLRRGAIRCLLFEVGTGIDQVLDCLKRAGFRLFAIKDGSLKEVEEAEVRALRNVVALLEQEGR